MRLQSSAKLFEVSLAFEQKRVRVAKRNFGETNSIARAQLRRDRKIDRNHVRDFWITANGLAIIEKQNRFAARRDLHGARRDRFRNKIDIVISFKPETIEPDSHSV